MTHAFSIAQNFRTDQDALPACKLYDGTSSAILAHDVTRAIQNHLDSSRRSQTGRCAMGQVDMWDYEKYR